MALKDILVHVDNNKTCVSRLETAVNLALAHDAHLTGVCVVTHPRFPGYLEAQIPSDVVEAQSAAAREMAEKGKKAFLDAVGKNKLAGECRIVEGELIDALSLHGRYSDVLVVSQRDPETSFTPGDMPDRLILSVGRPVIVLPYAGRYPTVGENVMVAWDASRLATRAVNDALPILQAAKKVCILALNPHGGDEGHGEVVGADIALHLARHGVKAEATHVYVDDIEVGDMLLSRAADAGADMIVMGAYGHRRLRELVLGGVTQHLLGHMTAPVLMSH